MIIQDLRPEIQSKGLTDASYFSMSQENIPHIFRVLRSSLYSDKILAVIREYSTNSMDAHVASGQENLPIEVTLPATLEPYFKVRDFGEGLSDSAVRTIYTSYGASSKRDSNDFVGQLGLGSKAAFAYVNSFTVISRHQGFKRTYEAFIDETDIGKIVCVNETETDEPSGVEIVVAVRESDIGSFYSRSKEFYRYFAPSPVFIDNFELGDYFKSVDKTESILSGSDWEIKPETNPVLIMGNIGYPIDLTQLSSETSKVLKNAILQAPIGSVHFTASRESLEYDRTTLVYFNSKAVEITDKSRVKITDYLAKAETLFDIRKLWKELHQKNSSLSYLYPQSIDWNGYKILDSVIRIKDIQDLKDAGIVISEASQKSRNNTGIRYTNCSVLSYQNDQDYYSMVLDDQRDSRRAAAYKAKALLEKLPLGFKVFRYSTDEQLQLILNHPQLKGIPVQYLKDVAADIPVIKRNQEKVACAIFLFNNRKQGSTAKEIWDITSLTSEDGTPEDPKIYVRIKNFMPQWNWYPEVEPHSLNIVEFEQCVKEARQMLGLPELKVYGVKTSLKESKMGKGWIHFPDWIRQEYDRKLKTSPGLKESLLINKALERIYRESYYRRLSEGYESFHKGNLRKRFQEIHRANQPDALALAYFTDFYETLGDWGDLKSYSQHKKNPYFIKAKETIQEILTKYPLLEYVSREATPESIKHSLEYIQLCQRKKPHVNCPETNIVPSEH